MLKLKTVQTVTQKFLLLAARYTPALVTVVTLFALVALAQPTDAGVISAPALDLTSEEVLARLVLDSVVNKQWGLLVSVLLTGIVALSRRYVPESTKVGAWLRSKAGGIVSTLLFSLGGAFTMQFVAHVPFSADMVLRAITVALSANGAWSVWKNLKEAMGESKATDAGKAAETQPPTDTLNQ